MRYRLKSMLLLLMVASPVSWQPGRDIAEPPMMNGQRAELAQSRCRSYP